MDNAPAVVVRAATPPGAPAAPRFGRRIAVHGTVQGVGFRPFVYRLAVELGLEGFAKVTRDETERKRVEEQARVLEIFAERDRIANELLASVVRQLFEAVLAMESAAQAAHEPNVRQRIQEAIDIVDHALKASRVAVLGISAPEG